MTACRQVITSFDSNVYVNNMAAVGASAVFYQGSYNVFIYNDTAINNTVLLESTTDPRLSVLPPAYFVSVARFR